MNFRKQKGVILVYLVLIIAIFVMVMLPIVSLFVAKLQYMRQAIVREQSLQIAEAGIDYYRWHLAHYPTDFQDGTGHAGPYVHTYTDFDTQQQLGQYSLAITQPQTGSTIVTVQSTGWTNSSPNIKRAITAKFGVQSLAQYAFLSNDIIWIGNTESVSGKLQSNNGVRFDGAGNAPIQSAKSSYLCPNTQGEPCPTTKPGVWGSASQDVQNFWQYPVPAADFSALTSNFANLKSFAQSGGIYLPPSGRQGYSLVFNANGTVTVYNVQNLINTNPKGWDVNGNAHTEHIDYKDRNLLFTQALPSNGVIYAEDNTWVEGTVKGKVTVAVAQLPYNPSKAPTIYIPNNIVYATKDGTNSLGLISQKDIIITYYSPSTLEIDAAMIAQNGSCQFFYYPGNIKTSITVFGAIISFGQWTWSWVDEDNNIVSGFTNTYSNYDGNFLYAPPPSFPSSSSTYGYQLLNWVSN